MPIIVLAICPTAGASQTYTLPGLDGLRCNIDSASAYEPPRGERYRHFPLAYGGHRARNTAGLEAIDWQHWQVERISLVYTAFPSDTSQWQQGHDQLLRQRLAYFRRQHRELRQRSVQWRLVPQSGAAHAAAARRRYHGFVLKLAMRTEPSATLSAEQAHTMQRVRSLVAGQAPVRDSTVVKALAQHPEWQELLVVMDWTASMYKFGAQVLRWQQVQLQEQHLKHLVLFTDKPKRSETGAFLPRRPGAGWGIHYASPDSLGQVFRTMERAMAASDGGLTPENDMEAVLKGIERYRGDFGDLVLIADNGSAVWDLALLANSRKATPINVILCGGAAEAPRTDYIEMAWRTGGTITNGTYSLDFQGVPYHRHERLQFGRWQIQKTLEGDIAVVKR